MFSLWRRALLVLTASTVLTAAAGYAQTPAAKPGPLPTERSWNVGKGGLSWDQLKGKVVIVDFWNFH